METFLIWTQMNAKKNTCHKDAMAQKNIHDAERHENAFPRRAWDRVITKQR